MRDGRGEGRREGRGAWRGARVQSSERQWLRSVSGKRARRARTLPLTVFAEMVGFPPAGLTPSARSASRITLSSAASASEDRSMSRPNTTSSTSERICFLAAAAVRLPRAFVDLGVPPRASQLA